MHIISYKIKVYCYYWLAKFGIFKRPTINYPETTINRQQAQKLSSGDPRSIDQDLLVVMGNISRIATAKRTAAHFEVQHENLFKVSYALLQLGYTIEEVSKEDNHGKHFVVINWDY